MNVLVTGAFGNLGHETTAQLLAHGHRVRCFGVRRRRHERAAAALAGHAEVFWGDITSADDVATAVAGQDAVIHLAFITPPRTETQPEWAREINVGGTANVLAAMRAQPQAPQLVFTSSVVVFAPAAGDTPRTAVDPVSGASHYAQHKIECEQMVRASGLPWVIFRVGASLARQAQGFDAATFELSLDTRVEFVDPRDVALAAANALTCPEALGKVLLIGGGSHCRMTHREMLTRTLEASGIGMLPDEAFGAGSIPSDWLDTTESESLLHYQQHTFDDLLREIEDRLRGHEEAMARMRPLLREKLLGMSPYWPTADSVGANR